MYSTLQIYTMALFFRSLQFCNCTLFLLMNSADLKNKTNCNPLHKHAAWLFFLWNQAPNQQQRTLAATLLTQERGLLASIITVQLCHSWQRVLLILLCCFHLTLQKMWKSYIAPAHFLCTKPQTMNGIWQNPITTNSVSPFETIQSYLIMTNYDRTDWWIMIWNRHCTSCIHVIIKFDANFAQK